MTFRRLRQTGIYVGICLLTVLAGLVPLRAQSQESDNGGEIRGAVRDSSGRPVANAIVALQFAAATKNSTPRSKITRTNANGEYRFSRIPEGSYFVNADGAGYRSRARTGPVRVGATETKRVDLTLVSAPPEVQSTPTIADKRDSQARPEFYDEPQFTVAGVTQASGSGGHGSDTVVRTTEALAKATASLGKESDSEKKYGNTRVATEEALRAAVASDPDAFEPNRQMGEFLAGKRKYAEAFPFLQRASAVNTKDASVHHLLGEVEENLGDPLAAVREYQLAAEIDASEANLFDWGTELLTHRALEPATAVFTKGHRKFPGSIRMLVALGVSWYARGGYDEASTYLGEASDIAPDDPTPYLFLGKMLMVEVVPAKGSVDRLSRFAKLQPNNALANYYYAVGLWKESGMDSVDSGARPADHNQNRDHEPIALVESLLQKAVRVDPKLGAAYLQLGIVYSERGDVYLAIENLKKAIAVGSEDEGTREKAHYRLAQIYFRAGDNKRGQEEIRLHDQWSKKGKEESERAHSEILEFVISQRNQNSVTPQNP